ncbi:MULTISPECIES: EF-P lysine aminoacylase EpmA [unclassified Zymobacter]|uniref:EF-P lysine aminoacylase EpmA n=1 Tax=unclassified Zymobacter TaxID=3048685 RepID=UPI0039C0E0D0
MTASSYPWAPSASLEALRFRARCMAIVRRFFLERDVLEVDTPVVCRAGTTDPFMDIVKTEVMTPEGPMTMWLQTSPEACMKRLLAAGSGPIYQIAHAFRDGEAGRRHNVEFTMLEWYQPGYSLSLLMNETVELIEAVLQRPVALRCHRYRQLFRDYLAFDPFTASLETLQDAAVRHVGHEACHWERDALLDVLMSHDIEPHLGPIMTNDGPVVIDAVTDYPASQAALARHHIDPEDGVTVAGRFELYWQGVELANGYDELTHAEEQHARLLADNEQRRVLGRPEVTVDEALVAALAHGMPEGSGVALGLDRLIMLAYGASSLTDVLPFPIDRA